MDPDELFSLGRGLLIHGNLDGAALRSKLDCIGKEVQQHLIQPDAVTADVLRVNIMNEHIELLLLGPHLGLDNADQAFHDLPQGDLIHI